MRQKQSQGARWRSCRPVVGTNSTLLSARCSPQGTGLHPLYCSWKLGPRSHGTSLISKKCVTVSKIQLSKCRCVCVCALVCATDGKPQTFSFLLRLPKYCNPRVAPWPTFVIRYFHDHLQWVLWAIAQAPRLTSDRSVGHRRHQKALRISPLNRLLRIICWGKPHFIRLESQVWRL